MEPRFIEQAHSTTVSLVATISMNGDSLTPLFLLKENVKCRSKTLQILKGKFLTFQTAKGYQDARLMTYYLENIMQPYVCSVQKDLDDADAKVFLICDHCAIISREKLQM